MASIFVVLILQPITNADVPESDYPAKIYLDIDDGSIISDSQIISITIQNEAMPNYASLEFIDSSGTRLFVDFTDDLESESDIGNWKEWSFSLEINPISVGACSCIAKINVEDLNGNIISFFSNLFILPDTSSDFQFPPTIHIISNSDFQWSSQTHNSHFVSMNMDADDPSLSYTISTSSSVKCSNSYIEVPTNSNNFYPSTSSNIEGMYFYNFPIDNLQDGWYDLYIFAVNPDNQKYSFDCASIRVDNNAPSVLIEGPESISEGTDYAIFEATSSYDGTWGIQGLTYIWSLVNYDEITDNTTIVLSGTDERSFPVNTMYSGKYQITLSIVDQAGNIGSAQKVVEVQNMPPIVKLTIDGEAVSDGGEFTLSRDSTCIIDATGSTDTSNDADNLRYVWRVNNIPTYEGGFREFSWPDGVDGDFILTIEVIDDDSISSQVSILVKDDTNEPSIPMAIIVFILSAIFFTYSVANMRKQTIETDIPKWS
jgi:hypothetical protein